MISDFLEGWPGDSSVKFLCALIEIYACSPCFMRRKSDLCALIKGYALSLRFMRRESDLCAFSDSFAY